MIINCLDRLMVLTQYLLPKRLLSKCVSVLARVQIAPIKNILIRLFVLCFKVDMTTAQQTDIRQYKSFNDFFTRPLQPGVRPIAEGADILVSPVDGSISQIGDITQQQIMQAKNHSYSALTLLGGDAERAAPFVNGKFATLYLSPKDYHRIHMPITGQLLSSIYIRGQLFSVSERSAQLVDGLFARNERLVNIFQTSCGPLALVMVGAVLVSSMTTVWAGQVTPCRRQEIQVSDYSKDNILLEKGAEMGHFNMGSTVILLAPSQALTWDTKLVPACQIKMGQALARLKNSTK